MAEGGGGGAAFSFSVASVVEDVLQQHGSRSRDLDLDARRAEEAAIRGYEPAAWLRKTVGVVGGKYLPAEPSEEEFRLGLRSGIILCNALNKAQPGAVSKVVESPCGKPESLKPLLIIMFVLAGSHTQFYDKYTFAMILRSFLSTYALLKKGKHQNERKPHIGDEEYGQLGLFDKPLPCCGCGIGWFCFLLGFLFPLLWYYCTILYLGNYYLKDPRERTGLAANAIAQVCDQLGVLVSSVSGVDMELKTEASLRHAQTLLAANQFSHAVAVANSLFRLCYKYNMQVENTTILLLLAEIHKKSGNAVLGHSINRNLYNCPNLKVSANIDVVSLNAPLYEPMTLPVNVLSNTVASTSAAGDVVLAGGVFPARYDVNASAVPETSKSAEDAGALEARKNDDFKEAGVPAGKTYEVSLTQDSVNSYIAWDFSLDGQLSWDLFDISY